MQIATQNVNLRIPGELLAYLEEYQKKHGLDSRTAVIIRAIQALRNQELIEGYKALALESPPDPLSLQPSRDGLHPSSEEDW